MFKTLVHMEVEWICSPSQMSSTCSSALISCYLLLPSFPGSASPFFSVMHLRSFLLIFFFSLQTPSLWRRSRRHVCQPYGSARGVRSRCARHRGSAQSSTCVLTHTEGSLCGACYRGRGHWLTTALSNSQSAAMADAGATEAALRYLWGLCETLS